MSEGDGDGWMYCTQDHRHWGRFGAAGLLIIDAQQSIESPRVPDQPRVPDLRRAVLQHRAAWTHEGGTWALPGGARNSHEDAVTTALREAREEADIAASSVAPLGWSCDDHGGWSYTTVLARPRRHISPHAANAESSEVRWWTIAEIDELPLHRGLAGAWPRLRRPVARLRLVVDAANVVGSRPDGWWRDRLGAARRLVDQLGVLARDGMSAASLPGEIDAGGLDAMLPAVSCVVEGAASPLADVPRGSAWWQAALSVHAAPRDADTTVVALARAALDDGEQTVVVTADRGLRQRLDPRVTVAGPTWLLAQLPDQ